MLAGGAPILALVAGCSTSSDGGFFQPITCTSAVQASCMSDAVCESLAGPLPASYLAEWQASCTRGDSGVFMTGPCPGAGRAGGCVNGQELFNYYATPNDPLTPAEVMAQCGDAGTFCP